MQPGTSTAPSPPLPPPHTHTHLQGEPIESVYCQGYSATLQVLWQKLASYRHHHLSLQGPVPGMSMCEQVVSCIAVAWACGWLCDWVGGVQWGWGKKCGLLADGLCGLQKRRVRKKTYWGEEATADAAALVGMDRGRVGRPALNQ